MTGIDLSSNMVSIALERANKIQDIRVSVLVCRGAERFTLTRLQILVLSHQSNKHFASGQRLPTACHNNNTFSRLNFFRYIRSSFSGGSRGGKSGHGPPSKLAMEFGPLLGGRKSNDSIVKLAKCKDFGPPSRCRLRICPPKENGRLKLKKVDG